MKRYFKDSLRSYFNIYSFVLSVIIQEISRRVDDNSKQMQNILQDFENSHVQNYDHSFMIYNLQVRTKSIYNTGLFFTTYHVAKQW